MPGAGEKPGRTWDWDEAADERWGFMMLLIDVMAAVVLRCWTVAELSGVSDMARAEQEKDVGGGGLVYMEDV